MHPIRIGVLCLLFTASTCFAQQTDSVSGRKLMSNEWMVKFAPLAIFDTDAGINFSGEYLLSKARLGFQLETQVILFDLYRNSGDGGFEVPDGVIRSGAPLGIKLRPEVRYYIGGMELRDRRFASKYVRDADPETRRRAQTKTYVALDFLYKNIRRDRLSEFTINNGGTQPAYMQQAIYSDFKEVTGFDFKVGFISPTSGDHWLAEIYLGFGVRYKKFWYRNLPIGAAPPRRDNNFWNDNNSESGGSYPSIPAGFKIIYRF